MSETTYIGCYFKVKPLQPAVEILIAELGLAGFESFVETEEGLTAYIKKQDWNPTMLDDIQIMNSDEFSISYTMEEIEQVNWNQEWEKNFMKVLI